MQDGAPLAEDLLQLLLQPVIALPVGGKRQRRFSRSVAGRIDPLARTLGDKSAAAKAKGRRSGGEGLASLSTKTHFSFITQL